MIQLPPWNDAMSDGCSVPKWMRALVPLETPAQISACRKHDEAYYYGGTRRDKALADARFLLRLLRTGMDPIEAERYYLAVLEFGGPEFRKTGVSWAFGGERFEYGEKAVPEEGRCDED